MSTKALRAINILLLVAALVCIVQLSRLIVDSFWPPAVIIGLYIGIVVLSILIVFVLNRRERAIGSGAEWTSGFGFVTRLSHPTDPMLPDEALAAFQRVMEMPAPAERVIEGRSCRECGHEELTVTGDEGPPYVMVVGASVLDQQIWAVGVMRFWSKQIRLAPEQAHDVQPQVAGSDAQA